MIPTSFKKYCSHPATRNLIFFAALWLATHMLVEAGVFGGRYQFNPSTETSKSFIDRGLISLSIPLFLIAVLLNPFFKFRVRRASELETITCLEEFHWNQAHAIIDRYGEEAPTVLAIRSGDDILSEAQKQDFLKSKLAAETILNAAKTQANTYEQ